MAQSAYQSRLTAQRQSSSSLYRIASSGRRITPLASYSTRLADQTTNAIDTDFDQRFNDGDVSADEYLKQLADRASRPGSTQMDIVQTRNRMRDVQKSVQEQALISTYQQATPGSAAQIEASHALSQFYTEYGNSLAPGTPAQSKTLGEAAKWSQQANDTTDQVMRNQRATTRLKELARISQIDSKDPQSAMQKAQVYARLRDEAMADGADQEAYRYDAQSNAETQNAQTLEAQGNKKSVLDYINTYKNQYYDGKISAKEMLQAINQAELQADQMDDPALSTRIDREKQAVEKQIQADGKKGLGSLKKKGFETLDTIDLDLKRLEDSFKYGKEFKPESEFIKSFVKEHGVPSLEDLVTLRALALKGEQDIVMQLEDNGIDVPENRRATIEGGAQQAATNRDAFVGGRLIAVVDPGTGEVKTEPIENPDQAQNFYTNPDTGLSFSMINKNDTNSPDYMNKLQEAINGGYASPQMYASTQPLMQSGKYTITKQKKGLFGIDALAKDENIDGNVPLYQTGKDGEYAVKASDVGMGDEKTFLKVEVNNQGDSTNLRVTDQKTTPTYGIDPVIVAPSLGGGLDRIYVKKDPVTGQVTGYYSEKAGRTLTSDELPGVLRGQGLPQTDQPIAPSGENGQPDPTAPAAPVAPQEQQSVAPASHIDQIMQSLTKPNLPGINQSLFNVGGLSLPSLKDIKIPIPQTLKPTANDRQMGQTIAQVGTYNQPQQILPGVSMKPSQIANPQTFGEKAGSAALRAGAAVQNTLKKVPLIGKFF